MLNFEASNTTSKLHCGYNRHSDTDSARLGGIQRLSQRVAGRNRGRNCLYTGYDCRFQVPSLWHRPACALPQHRNHSAHIALRWFFGHFLSNYLARQSLRLFASQHDKVLNIRHFRQHCWRSRRYFYMDVRHQRFLLVA